MIRRAIWGATLALLLSVTAAGQVQEDYLDVFTVKVKSEKRAEFERLVKMMVDANRRNQGSDWVALAVVYGEGNVVYFVSIRQSYAAIEKGNEMFYGAISKAYGKAGAEKMFQDFDNCVVSSRSEVRRRRWDLSSNVPADAAAMAKLVGEARWVRTIMVRVPPGQNLKFEEQLRAVNAAAEKATPRVASYVAQVVAGQQGTVYYISTFRTSLGGFDGATPLPQMMGEEAYEKFLKGISESVLTTETTINRFWPELSNPSEDIASAAPDFWRPKPATKPAAKAPAAKKND
jgi:quinol monooxygenase YgiN